MRLQLQGYLALVNAHGDNQTQIFELAFFRNGQFLI